VEKLRISDGEHLHSWLIDKLFQGALVRDLSPLMHQGSDDVVFDFSVREWHVAARDGVEDASRCWAGPQERIVRLGRMPFQGGV
jgi:hypothetical protein